MLRTAVISFLVVLLATPAAWAQDQTDLWRSFAAKLPPGAFVVVHLRNGKTVQGHLVDATEDAVRIVPKTRIAIPAREISFAEVQSITPRKEGWSPGAKVLTGYGAAASVLLILAAALFSSWD